jgi:hypothetical protein
MLDKVGRQQTLGFFDFRERNKFLNYSLTDYQHKTLLETKFIKYTIVYVNCFFYILKLNQQFSHLTRDIITK